MRRAPCIEPIDPNSPAGPDLQKRRLSVDFDARERVKFPSGSYFKFIDDRLFVLIDSTGYVAAPVRLFSGQSARANFPKAPAHVYTLRKNMAVCRARGAGNGFIRFVQQSRGNFDAAGGIEMAWAD
jgi:hypothetical protein